MRQLARNQPMKSKGGLYWSCHHLSKSADATIHWERIMLHPSSISVGILDRARRSLIDRAVGAGAAVRKGERRWNESEQTLESDETS
jgi:hypothetical protein